jgi:hypothetical protein
MVQLERRGGDHGLEGVVVVGQGRQDEGHGQSPCAPPSSARAEIK